MEITENEAQRVSDALDKAEKLSIINERFSAISKRQSEIIARRTEIIYAIAQDHKVYNSYKDEFESLGKEAENLFEEYKQIKLL